MDQQIRECAEKRCEYIMDEQSKMIDSLLERENKRRIFNFDLINDQLQEEFQKQLDLNIGELHINYELSKNHGEIKDLN